MHQLYALFMVLIGLEAMLLGSLGSFFNVLGIWELSTSFESNARFEYFSLIQRRKQILEKETKLSAQTMQLLQIVQSSKLNKATSDGLQDVMANLALSHQMTRGLQAEALLLEEKIGTLISRRNAVTANASMRICWTVYVAVGCLIYNAWLAYLCARTAEKQLEIELEKM